MVEGVSPRSVQASPPEDRPGEAKTEAQRVRVISVTSGKGGVGKTNIVANLGFALQRLGQRVLVLDADLGLANMDVLLGLTARYNIEHVLSGEKRLEDVIVPIRGGFNLLPAASGIQELTELDPTQRLFLLNELDALQRAFDIMLIDTGAGISSNVMYFNFAATEKVVVVTNEPTSLTDAYALIKVLVKRYRQRRFKILVNSVRNGEEGDQIFRHLTLVVDRFLGTASMDYLGWVPFDEHIPKAVRRQRAFMDLYPDAEASKRIMEVAHQLMVSDEGIQPEGDIRFFWQRLFAH
jgi:flagellar biosynthesis protein FlhG